MKIMDVGCAVPRRREIVIFWRVLARERKIIQTMMKMIDNGIVLKRGVFKNTIFDAKTMIMIMETLVWAHNLLS